ncbi:hypothetical protein [Halobacillus sp. Nhm2S1]|uniref:hypothetical protein n=1 Tax=Halobacillus sp. Nhm2S1 TaxID=2866716 RepID=UPI001C72EE7A|nr:hypothetical protein [Halobacillus sp. Nhm2S1]MBX0358933.1 hypothetical protein [Halobacillus sp. Nhm2S1]
MKFNTLFFNGKRVDITGQYSHRIDGSLVLQLDKSMPSREMHRLTEEGISYLGIERAEGGQWVVQKGPFSLSEKYGLIVLSLFK